MAVRENGALETIGGMIKGLMITAKYLFKPTTTIKYPFEKKEISDRWRGPLFLRGVVGEYEPEEGKEIIPPCKGTCPANVDPRLQNTLVAQNKYLEAYEVVRDRNILPGVLGRICNHPCEDMCRRGAYDEAIAIKNLHRFIQDKYLEVRPKQKPFKVKYKEKIAIVGSGPAGLAAAYSLTKRGYQVQVFDRHPYPGGMLMIGVPRYRLPRENFLEEIGLLQDMGINIKTGIDIGKDIGLDELSSQYDAVIVATGLQNSRGLNIPGTDFPQISYAIPFLKEVNITGKATVGEEVIVVGGGNVSIDVARSAVRVGAKVVKMVCLEKREEMPAFSWEIEEAIEEGIMLYPAWGPKRVVGDGKVEGLEVVCCVSVFDEQGRFSPRFDEGNVQVIKGDMIIFAIGQYGDMAFAEGSSVEVDERGRLVLNPETWQTTVPNVFACGEITTGPSTAVKSIGTGHEAAEKVHRFLRGKKINSEKVIYTGVYPTPIGPPMEFIKEPDRKRHHMPKLKPAERRGNFKQIELGYSDEHALEEAMRCLQCDSMACIGCRFCARACPDFCIDVERKESRVNKSIVKWDYDMEKCCFCGLCVNACPTKTLTMSQEFKNSSYDRSIFSMDKDFMSRMVKE